jgi:outer membrane receptor protein involved in Fe transport
VSLTTTKFRFPIGAVLYLAPTVLLFAQETAVIEEIQVTATRRPTEIRDVSAALTVITAEEISRTKLATDSLAAKPGVFLQQTTPGQGAAIIRGLKGSEVLHLVDGMRLNNAIFRNAPTQYLSLVAPGTLDRIEVVRGAPASLYGSDAVGGVVQVLSRMPELDAAGIKGDAYLAFDTADLAKVLRGSVEFGDEKLAALASGEYLETGDRRTGSGARVGPSGYESKGGRIAVSATPKEGERWLFDLQMARQPMTPRVDELVPGFGQTEPSSSEFYFAPNDRVFAHIRHTRDSGPWGATWNVDLGWQRIVDDRISRDYQSDIRRYENNSSDLVGLTASAAGETESGSWIAGIDVYHDEVRSSRYEEDLVSGLTQTVTSRFPDGATVDQAAIFGNYLLNAGERNTVSGGLRYSVINTDLPQTGAVPATSVDQNDISADLGWTFDLSGDTQLTANIGHGFRAPNVFDLGTLGERPGNRFNIPNPNLESESITQLDAGVRHRGERWDMDIVFFTLHYTDRIASILTGAITPDGRDVTQSQNVASADIHGIEAGGHFVFTESLTADIVVNYVRGEQADTTGSAEPADRIPPLNGRVALTYYATDSIRIEPYLLFSGEQDRLSERDVRDVRINPEGTPGWMTANIMASWDINNDWRVTAQLENLFDKQYRVHGSGIDAVGQNLFLSVQTNW